MHIVLVNIHVKDEYVDEFITLTKENAKNSIKEPGIARFDIIQQADEPNRFILIEEYLNSDAQPRHRETGHYKIWKEKVAEMMAEPRVGLKYINIFPETADR